MSLPFSTTAFLNELAEPFTAEALFDQLPDIVFFVKDEEGRYVAANRTLVERCGLQDKRELLGRRPSEVLGKTLGRSYEDQDAIVIRSGQPIVDQLELHVIRSRDIGWCLTSKLPLAGRGGGTAGLVGVSRDLGLPDVSSDEFAHIADAIDYAERNIAERPTIRDLARTADMSVYQLDRRMQRVFGLTTGQWYLKTRISFASRLLVESEMSIANVAFEAGYADQSSFTRQFRRSTGLSPSQYRGLRR
ncbi:MAG: AraC family transcriptional regulator [Woeseiaceae bacterium]|nr:AraC family transcriptional regulator [Woeseiaceae bacterium]